MDPLDYSGLELAPSNLLVSLLATQVPIILGLSLLESGASQGAERFQSIFTRHLLVWLVATLAYGLVGFAIMYPGQAGSDLAHHWHSLLGNGTLVPDDAMPYPRALFLTDLMVQSSFCTLAALLAAAAFPRQPGNWLTLLFALVFGAVLFPVFGRWHWGGGWLSQRGFLDFAGGTLIYVTAGVISLTVAVLCRPSADTPFPEITNSRITAWLLGVAFLWFIPSTLALVESVGIRGGAWRYPAVQFTIDSSAVAGGIGALFVSLAAYGRVSVPRVCIGLLAGMATASAGPDLLPVQTLALAAGGTGALSVLVSNRLTRARIPDPVVAVAGFGLGGFTGTLVTGLHSGQVGVQCLGLAANALWSALVVALFLVFLFRPGSRSLSSN